MKAFFVVFKREVNKVKSRPFILFMMIVWPLFMCFCLSYTFSQGAPVDLPIVAVDQDNTEISRLILRMVDSTKTCKIKYRTTDIEESRKLLVSRKAYAVVYIPQDFTKNLKRGERPQLVYYYNNQMILVGGLINKDIATAIKTAIAGADAKIRMKKGTPKNVAIQKVNIVSVDEHIKANPYLNYSYFLSYTLFAHGFQVMILFLGIWSFGIEFKEGTTKEWLKVANNSMTRAIFGKILFYTIVYTLLFALTMYIFVVVYGAPFHANIPFLLLSVVAFVVAYQMYGVMFIGLTGNLRAGFSFGAFFASLGFSLAGITYPTVSMPLGIRMYSSLLPIRPFVSLFVDQTLRGFQPHYEFIYLRWLLFLILFTSCFIPLLKKKAENENYWFKI